MEGRNPTARKTGVIAVDMWRTSPDEHDLRTAYEVLWSTITRVPFRKRDLIEALMIVADASGTADQAIEAHDNYPTGFKIELLMRGRVIGTIDPDERVI